ncbi:MAG: PQQ-binding-like beta-propeller repeat protein [Gemmataceae bacterium]
MVRKPLGWLVLALVQMLFVPTWAWAGADYPAFRGDGSGRTEARTLPLEWTPTSVAWKVKLPGYGQSSPVVAGGKVFLTSIEGPNKEKNLVSALDLQTGSLLWKKELPATQTVKADFSVSRAAPTPVVDADTLIVFFESGELAGFRHDGTQLWLRSLVKEYGPFKNGHQLGSSLAQTKQAAYVLIDHQGPSYLLAVDKKTGKNLWKTERKSRTSWTSPVVIQQGSKELLLVSSGGSVDVYDLVTGKQLSTYTEVGNNNVPSATALGNRVVVGASDPPRGANRELTLRSCCCLLLDAEGKLSSQPAWHSEKATASFASPLIHGDCVYFVNAVGVLSCLDLKTGKEHYSERLGRGCWASPVAVGERIYCFGRDTVTVVVKAGPVFEKLATNRTWEESKEKPAETPRQKEKEKGKEGGPPDRTRAAAMFGDPILYGAAVVDGMILLRTGTELAAIKAK